ncbi:hypothetical protein PG993_000454 [Apiospora rasikravindrae]|uniref:Uncharacterized protein n=1 Tax=Apiospora rasikravindrae TaxID=990691 RepID=A0ABR1U8L9_9PEZI
MPSKKDKYLPTLVNIDDLKAGLRCLPEADDVMTTTTSDLPGYKITRILGAIYADSWGYRPGGPFLPGSTLQRYRYSTYNMSLSRLIAETRARGGNAILRVRRDDWSLTGTAVIAEKL